jgi:hypothetical protein
MSESNQPPPLPADRQYAHGRRSAVYRRLKLLAAIAVSLVICIAAIRAVRPSPAPHYTTAARPLPATDPVTAAAIADAGQAKSAANLQKIGELIYEYCSLHNGDYPDSFPTLLLEGNYVSSVFVNPASTDTPATGLTQQAIADQLVAGGHCSYVYLGRGLDCAGSSPEDAIAAYEIPLHPGDGANVLLVYGDVKYVDAAHVAKIIAQAKAGSFPVRLPVP